MSELIKMTFSFRSNNFDGYGDTGLSPLGDGLRGQWSGMLCKGQIKTYEIIIRAEYC